MSDTLVEKFLQDGFVILEDFLNEEEVEELRKAGEALAENIPDNDIHTFKSGEEKRKDQYFLDSADKVSYFYETSVTENGNLDSNMNGDAETGKTSAPRNLLNKVGHALHKHHPVFGRVASSTPVREICYRLGLEDPAIAQSMYIYKNPKIGGEVLPHQDASYLYAEPPSALVGFWIALDDATTKNGCLWFASGSHKSGVHRRFMRTIDNTTGSNEVHLAYDSPAPSYPSSIFRPVPVKKGTCIVIHGLVLHKSDANTSNDPRHAFTFHVLDQKGSKYSPSNWLQLPEGQSFVSLYSNKHNLPASN
ncbi:phytanoyl-CoA dioxygenase domain-containing protein 1-like [Ischnura elegans]|uniref:phytanoyl-CoA dioxygenase domain-containing protein 1-like n=1 Tax=Ischnura elegans TaxID=197161 RepID=UPI001ED87042|nr:phytanoyl-CoA dioxygenase domain-containing protein 1-like [Ischnura elegans]